MGNSRKSYFTWLWLMLPCLAMGQTDDLRDVRNAIMITFSNTYDTLLPKPKLDTLRQTSLLNPSHFASRRLLYVGPVMEGLEELVLIYAPPYAMHILGTIKDNGGYFLSKQDDDRVFFCLPDQDGISFLPMTKRTFIEQEAVATGRKDSLFSYVVFEKAIQFDNGLLTYWFPDTTAIFENTSIPVPIIPWLIQTNVNGIGNTTRAIAVQPLNLHPKYIRPEMSHAPVTFETDYEAFQEAGRALSPFAEDPYFTISGFIPHRRPDSLPNYYLGLQAGDMMPAIIRNLFNQHGKIDDEVTRSEIRMVFLIDYDILRPVPDFLTEWIASIQNSHPNARIVILTTADKATLKQTWKVKPALAEIPHGILSQKMYERFEWRDPLSYLIVDRAGKIRFMESAFDVHKLATIEKELDAIPHGN